MRLIAFICVYCVYLGQGLFILFMVRGCALDPTPHTPFPDPKNIIMMLQQLPLSFCSPTHKHPHALGRTSVDEPWPRYTICRSLALNTRMSNFSCVYLRLLTVYLRLSWTPVYTVYPGHFAVNARLWEPCKYQSNPHFFPNPALTVGQGDLRLHLAQTPRRFDLKKEASAVISV